MNLTVYAITLSLAFITGFLLGVFYPQRKNPVTAADFHSENRINSDFPLNEEYRNFLNYDGTRQI